MNNSSFLLPHPIAGFWRRLFAFILDCIFIGILLFVIIIYSESFFYQHPLFSIFLGYIIIVLYFALLNSQFNDGQTVFKKILKIKTISLNNELISFPKAILRESILFFPICFSSIPIYISSLIFNNIIIILFSALLLMTLYFFIFNRHNRRTLHDFVAKTIVVEQQQSEMVYQKTWSKHFYIISLIFILFCSIFFYLSINNQNDSNAMINQMLKKQPDVYSIQLVSMNYNTNEKFLVIQAFVKDKTIIDSQSFAQKLFNDINEINPKLKEAYPDIRVNLISQFQFGIIRYAKSSSYSFP